MSFICINGYEGETYCDHCGRALSIGVKTNNGTIGADCFVKMIKADRKRFSGNGKPGASRVRDYAKMVERCSDKRLSEMGYGRQHFQFELAN